MKKTIPFISLVLLLLVEISRVYYIMPFPGSQKMESIGYAYWIHNNIWWIRILLLIPVTAGLLRVLQHRSRSSILLAVLLLIYAVVFYLFNFRFQADKMFYQPGNKVFLNALQNKVKADRLVLGVVVNGEAKAYPIQIIGYHHQVRDSIDHLPVMITYCTVCRTGRVYKPEIDGRPEDFRLVGMDHFNAMFEDAATKSWWRQATGYAVAGPLKGHTLQEIPSEQTTLEVWLKKYPHSLVMQPDEKYEKQYASLDKFDNGTIDGSLEKRDSASWQFKSWVIGVDQNGHTRAYDWNQLVNEKLITDSLPRLPLMVVLENDTASFHVLNRDISSQVLQFRQTTHADTLQDINTGSLWNRRGLCVDGQLKGTQLQPVQAYQEFWHSWKIFHPHTSIYEN